MTIWAECDCTIAEWKSVQDQFEKHFIAAGAPPDMMLIYDEGGDFQNFRLLMALPDGTPLALYEGFTEIRPENLPKSATLIVGHNNKFDDLFSYRQPGTGPQLLAPGDYAGVSVGAAPHKQNLQGISKIDLIDGGTKGA